MAMRLRPYHFNLKPDDRAKLARLAAAQDMTVSALIRLAIREFLAREERRGKVGTIKWGPPGIFTSGAKAGKELFPLLCTCKNASFSILKEPVARRAKSRGAHRVRLTAFCTNCKVEKSIAVGGRY